MDTKTILLALTALLGWGVGSFIAKLATNKIGSSAIFWDMVGFTVVTAIYAAIVFKPSVLLTSDKSGVWFAIASGVTGGLGGVAFYTLMSQKDASVVTPLTALYPALTAILAFFFLKESLTLTKIFGIVLASVALILLGM